MDLPTNPEYVSVARLTVSAISNTIGFNVEEIEDIYDLELSESMISDITDKVIPRIEEQKSRPLDSIYPVIYIDAVHFSVKDAGIVKKRDTNVILGATTDGMKEVLGLYVGNAEYSKYWLSVFNELKIED